MLKFLPWIPVYIYGYICMYVYIYGFLDDLVGKRICLKFRKHGRYKFNSWVRKILWRRKWQPTPVSLPGKSHGQRSYSPWDCKELDMTERLGTHTYIFQL